MGNIKRRNHYIPQLLLKRFASRSSGEKFWVWQFLKGKTPVEISIKDAAVTELFYGKPEDGLEDAFGLEEAKLAEALSTIEAGNNPNQEGVELTKMVRLLFLRTKSFRERFLLTTNRLIDAIEKAIRNPSNDKKFRQKLLIDFEKTKEQQLTTIPPMLRKTAETNARLLFTKGNIRQFIDPVLTKWWERWNQQADKAAEAGHLEGLSKTLSKLNNIEFESKIETPHEWLLIKSESAFILGDGCGFGVEDGQPTVFLQNSNSKQEPFDIYIPISKSSVLVGRIIGSQKLLTVEQINVASAKQSFNIFFALRNSSLEENLVQLVGENSVILNDEEFDEILKQHF